MTVGTFLLDEAELSATPDEAAAALLFATELEREAERLVRHSIETLLRELPDYTKIVAAEGDATLAHNLRGHFKIAASLARTLGGDQPQESIFAFSVSAERAAQGFPLEALLRSTQIVTHLVWDWLMDNRNFGAARDDVIRRCWPLWLRYAEHLARDAAAAYLSVATERAQQDTVLRRGVVEQLVTGRLTHLEAQRALREMGFDDSKPFRLAVLRWWDVPDGELFEVLQHARDHCENALESLSSTRPLTMTRDQDLIIVFQCTESECAGSRDQLRLLLQHPRHRAHRVSGAISEALMDLSTAHRAYSRLLHSVPVGRASGSVNFMSEISLLDHAIGAVHDSFSVICPPDLNEFVIKNEKSVPLWHETLEALASHNLSVREAAASLHLHPNTVYYRLNQISTLSNRDMSTLQGLLDVLIAFRLKSHLKLSN